MTTKIIGIDKFYPGEPEFAEDKPGYNKKISELKDFEISELKSSYALFSLYKIENKKLANFVYNILNRIYRMTELNLDEAIKKYNNIIKSEDISQKSKAWNYPLIDMYIFTDSKMNSWE